jgi:two-component system, OmpR family, response regulator VanR
MNSILIVDDAPDILLALEVFIESEGWHVLKGVKGQDALERLDENELDLILMDVMVPALTGLEALPEIRVHQNLEVFL